MDQVQTIPVYRIRPEAGLGRKRDKSGHEELCRSIAQFGVLTPIAVRRAPDNSAEFLLVKGQGRTLACRQLGLGGIPAIVMDDEVAEAEKVQQFLVENVARLRMRPIDRALLVAHARKQGEETAVVARRFGISASSVRKLDAQLEGATTGELAALRSGAVSLALHGVITRHVTPEERSDVGEVLAERRISAREADELFVALGWRSLTELGSRFRSRRLHLLEWACGTLTELPRMTTRERLQEVAERLPAVLEGPAARVSK